MTVLRPWRVAVALAFLWSFEGAANADELDNGSGFPTAYVARPLVMMPSMGGLTLQGGIGHVTVGPLSSRRTAAIASVMYGLVKDVEVGATVAPIQLAPDSSFGSTYADLPRGPGAYVMYRFLRSKVELADMVRIDIGTAKDTNSMVMYGLNALTRLGPLRLDAGLMFGSELTTHPMGMPTFSAAAHYQFTNRLAAGVLSGATMMGWSSQMTTIPLRAEAIYAVPDGPMPIFDFGAQFGFPSFLMPGIKQGDVLVTSTWTALVTATYWINF